MNLINTEDDNKSWNTLNPFEKKLITRMINARKTKASIRSLVNYVKIVKRVYKLLGKEFNGVGITPLTNNVDDNIKMLNKKYKNSKDVLWAIINVLKAFPQAGSAIKKYSDAMGQKLKIDKTERGENLKNTKQSRVWMNYDKVLIEYKNNRSKLSLEDRTLISFVIFFPRRLADWYRMKLHKRGAKKKKDKINENYLNLNDRNIPVTFEFNRQKTADVEKDNIKFIPPALKGMITDYIRKMKLQNGDLLFPKSSGGMYSASDFSNKISKIFNTITGRQITNNIWRHIYINRFASGNKYNLNQKTKLAENMGHSFKTQQEYVKK
jgi:hypothetical protein